MPTPSKILLTFALGLVSMAPACFGLDTSKLKPTGYVDDFANVIDAANKQLIIDYCGNLERTTGAQMAVVTVDSIDSEPVEDVGNRLYRQWGIGQKGKDEGVLILLSIKDHKYRVEVGYGLEPIINDGYAGDVMRSVRPVLRQGNYGDALYTAARELGNHVMEAKGVAGEAIPVAQRPVRGNQGGSWIVIVFVIIFVVAILARRGGGGGGYGGGGGSSFWTWMLINSLLNNNRRGGGGSWGGGGFGGSSGGGGFGGGSSDGGFGGFGGGSSGGGGASGDW